VKEKSSDEVEVEASDETESTEEEPEVEASDETEVVEEEVEATEETEEVVNEESIEEEVTEEPEAEATDSQASFLVNLKNLGAVLSEVIESLETTEASEPEKEVSEIDMLTDELAKANDKISRYESVERGTNRLVELAQAGVNFSDEGKTDKVTRIGVMSDEEFEAYREDLLSAVKASAPEKAVEEVTEETKASTTVEVPPFFLPNVESPENMGENEFSKMYR